MGGPEGGALCWLSRSRAQWGGSALGISASVSQRSDQELRAPLSPSVHRVVGRRVSTRRQAHTPSSVLLACPARPARPERIVCVHPGPQAGLGAGVLAGLCALRAVPLHGLLPSPANPPSVLRCSVHLTNCCAQPGSLCSTGPAFFLHAECCQSVFGI